MPEPAAPGSGAEAPEPANALFLFIARRAGLLLGAVAALTVVALLQLVDFRTGAIRLAVDPSLDPLVATDDPERQFYDQVRQRFGSDESVLVVLEAPDIYAPAALKRLAALTRALYDLPGVAEAKSLTSVPLVRVSAGEVAFEKLKPAEFDDPALPARLKAAVAENPLLRGNLVAADGRAAAVLLRLEAQTDRELLELGLAQKILAAADAHAAAGMPVRVTGAPIVRAATSEAVVRQLRWVVPAVVVLLAALLAFAFRSVGGVLLPLLTMLIALTWTLATLSAFGRPLNLITSLVPPLLVTMGLAYCAHVLSEFYALARKHPDVAPLPRIVALLQEVAAPVLLTGMTTGIGLAALALNDQPAIREFAWLSALGVVYTALLALTFVPAALRLWGAPRRRTPLPGEWLFEQGSRALGRFDTQRRGLILFTAAVVFVLAVAAALRIEVGDRFVGIFAPEARVRADFERVSAILGGVTPLVIAIDAEVADTFTDVEVLRALERLEQWLTQQPEVGAVTGLTDHVKVLANVLGGTQRYEIPQQRELIKQVLFFGDGEDLRGIVDGRRSSTIITLRLKVDDTNAIADFLTRLAPQLEQLPARLHPRATGSAVLLTRSMQTVTMGQLQSVGLALLLVYLCLAVQFGSLAIGLLASLPTVLQTALYFGALGASGITLNTTTSLVECLVLGLAVDDTIHYLVRFNAAAKRTGSESAAATAALTAVLRPVTITKAILAVGFLTLVTGELHNQVLFGWLAAGTLVAAWLVDVFVTPAFMSGVRVVSLWDSLRLNLGQDVQRTIPLFAGLSTRRARIFALMANLQAAPAGTRVIRQGDRSGDIYVVIEGELAVWAERDGVRQELSTLSRGAVVGETGYFGQQRTANVDALTRVRLLRFDDADQERICRRYPAIAARVFLNLNRIQAERRAHMGTLARA